MPRHVITAYPGEPWDKATSLAAVRKRERKVSRLKKFIAVMGIAIFAVVSTAGFVSPDPKHRIVPGNPKHRMVNYY